MTRLVCFTQIDMKSLVAYSSIGHMSLVIAGTLGGKVSGVYGGLLIIVSHGLCSSGLFCMVNMLYERRGRRRLCIRKGALLVLPSFCCWWFVGAVRARSRRVRLWTWNSPLVGPLILC